MKKVLRFLRRWNELLTIPAALLLWWASPALIRFVDPTAAVFDAGVFQIILWSIIAFLIFHGVVWLVLKLSWWTIYGTIDDLYHEFLNITVWQKLKFGLALFSLFLLSLVLLANAIA